VDRKQTFIVGVSGGSDSMVLLHLLNLSNQNIVVAHVNYQKRNSADYDQKLVEEYCIEYGIPFEVLIADHLPKGNFQDQARKARYQFFQELAEKHNACGVVVAHHMDDHLETYLLQKESKRIPLYWGLKEVVEIDGLRIYRPLLDFSKEDIVSYAKEKGIIYGEDETNQLLLYKRNQIRHERVSLLNEKEREALLQEIVDMNKILEKKQEEVSLLLKKNFEQGIYQESSQEIRLEAIRQWLLNHEIDSRHFSLAHLKEIDQLMRKEKNTQYEFANKILYVDYGHLSIADKERGYSYLLEEIVEMETAYFKVKKEGDSLSAITVSKEDFPLEIRNWKTGDKIELRYGHKKVSRFLIERKIPAKTRALWPVIVNNKNEIIFVLGIGCDVKHYSNIPNMFVVK
jgi:tRNA(Ile)-lysidine synthetase, N-terminal domain/tRNA(Ile)-lysidine synthetase, C-terminal domain